MKNLVIIALLVLGLYIYLAWKPSTSDIANEIQVGETIVYQGKEYLSDWGVSSENIKGYIRRKDRHFDKNMPIVTFDLILTSGEFNDPDVVKIRNKGDGNYFLSADKKPEGTIIVYHAVPFNLDAQKKLDEIEQGETVTLVGKISQNSEIRSNSGSFVKLMHDNHKYILVEDAYEM